MAMNAEYSKGGYVGPGYATEQTMLETPQSAVGSAEYAMEQARDLAVRLQSLADRILGPLPPMPTAAGSGIGGERMGVFPLLQSSSERTRSMIADGFDAINRIERSLP